MMQRSVANAAITTRSELLMVTPFFIPGKEGMQLIKDLHERKVRVRILTNSLMSTPQLIAHSVYMHYRQPLLESNVELYEMRSLPSNPKGMGQSAPTSSWGNYGLHAKLFVFDRRQVYIGSMNFDERSMRLNTEVGLLIDSPDLARQIAARFDAMVQPRIPMRWPCFRAMRRIRHIWSGVRARTAMTSNTRMSRRRAPGKESRSIFCRCFHWIRNYESPLASAHAVDPGTFSNTERLG